VSRVKEPIPRTLEEREVVPQHARAEGREVVEEPAPAREARIALALARTPLTTADALCALAVASSMQGKAKAARASLDQAARLAPWYPRLTTVQRIIATRAGTAVLPPVDAAADTSSVFDDPWSAPSRD